MRDSIIMKDEVIGKNCVVDKAIIAENCKIGDEVVMGIGRDVPNRLKPSVYSFGLVTIGEKFCSTWKKYRLEKILRSVVRQRAEDYPDGVLDSGETLIKAGERV